MRSALFLLLFGMSLAGFLSGCTSTGEMKNQAMLRGFNAMQHENVGWNEPQARHSMQRMASLGSNAVVLIAFLEQDSTSAVDVHYSNAVTFAQLQKAIEYAHELNLEVILKPQMLVRNSWASAISHDSQQGWGGWFKSYSKHVLKFARFAAQNKVQAFVIGTELSKASGFVDWSQLIRQVRSVFPGQITYAAHNIDGLHAFPFWNELDAVSVTLYPSLGRSGQYDEMQTLVQYTVAQLETVAKQFDLPLWVLEIGMPSAVGASLKPWEWQSLKDARVDLQLQRDAIDIWLRALDQPWVNGIFIWTWYSDAASGGAHNADYTPQNKPAEQVIQRYWRF